MAEIVEPEIANLRLLQRAVPGVLKAQGLPAIGAGKQAGRVVPASLG
jgi:hypothetical protein